MQFSGNFKRKPLILRKILAQAPPLGSKLRWAPLTKILDPRLAHFPSLVVQLCHPWATLSTPIPHCILAQKKESESLVTFSSNQPCEINQHLSNKTGIRDRWPLRFLEWGRPDISEWGVVEWWPLLKTATKERKYQHRLHTNESLTKICHGETSNSFVRNTNKDANTSPLQMSKTKIDMFNF